jgi:hypothetical protein
VLNQGCSRMTQTTIDCRAGVERDLAIGAR